MIGDILRQERERQHLTIKDIERGTSIRSLYIEAIENGDFGTLPGDVYAKGFIRNYANFLKLNADDCVRRYVSENHPEQAAAAAAAEADMEESARQEEPEPDFSGKELHTSRSYGRVAVLLAAVAIFGGAAYFLLGSDDSVATRSPSKPQAQQEKPLTAAPVQAKADTAAPAKAAPSGAAQGAPAEKKQDGIQVTANFTDRCWTRVIADGQTVYEGTAEQGKTMSWKGKERVTITAGNAGAMEITHNGKSLGKAGEIGQVVDKVFTKDTVN